MSYLRKTSGSGTYQIHTDTTVYSSVIGTPNTLHTDTFDFSDFEVGEYYRMSFGLDMSGISSKQIIISLGGIQAIDTTFTDDQNGGDIVVEVYKYSETECFIKSWSDFRVERSIP